MKTDIYSTLGNQKKLMLYQVNYGEIKPGDSAFFEGYSVKNTKWLNRDSVKLLNKLFADSSNFITDKSKNCVLAASYGFKVSNDSANYVVFIGDDPCKKVLILNQTKNTETILDLADSNSITPFIKKAFQ
jgi:hypothetical protein